MRWIKRADGTRVSDCGRYELRGAYADGRFAWRGRVVDTDVLVASSADLRFVEALCEAHASAAETSAIGEAP